MNSQMAAGFQAGSGVPPSAMKLVVMSISAGVILVIFAWIVTRLIDGYRNDEISAAEIAKTSVLAVIALCTLFTFLALL